MSKGTDPVGRAKSCNFAPTTRLRVEPCRPVSCCTPKVLGFALEKPCAVINIDSNVVRELDAVQLQAVNTARHISELKDQLLPALCKAKLTTGEMNEFDQNSKALNSAVLALQNKVKRTCNIADKSTELCPNETGLLKRKNSDTSPLLAIKSPCTARLYRNQQVCFPSRPMCGISESENTVCAYDSSCRARAVSRLQREVSDLQENIRTIATENAFLVQKLNCFKPPSCRTNPAKCSKPETCSAMLEYRLEDCLATSRQLAKQLSDMENKACAIENEWRNIQNEREHLQFHWKQLGRLTTYSCMDPCIQNGCDFNLCMNVCPSKPYEHPCTHLTCSPPCPLSSYPPPLCPLSSCPPVQYPYSCPPLPYPTLPCPPQPYSIPPCPPTLCQTPLPCTTTPCLPGPPEVSSDSICPQAPCPESGSIDSSRSPITILCPPSPHPCYAPLPGSCLITGRPASVPCKHAQKAVPCPYRISSQSGKTSRDVQNRIEKMQKAIEDVEKKRKYLEEQWTVWCVPPRRGLHKHRCDVCSECTTVSDGIEKAQESNLLVTNLLESNVLGSKEKIENAITGSQNGSVNGSNGSK